MRSLQIKNYTIPLLSWIFFTGAKVKQWACGELKYT